MLFTRILAWGFLLLTVSAINPYRLLGVSRSVDTLTVNRAFRRMLMLYQSDPHILSVIKDAFREIKMYHSLDRGLFKPKKKKTMRQPSYDYEDSMDFFRVTLLIFLHLIPVTLLLYCLALKPNKKNQTLVIQRQQEIVQIEPEYQPQSKPVICTVFDDNRELVKKESVRQRKVRIIGDLSHFEEPEN